MRIPDSIIDPAQADPDTAYRIALVDDDWDHWTDLSQALTYNGRRRRGARWNLRNLASGDPVDWSYDDTEVIVLEALS